jgi:hypothetical protein
MTNRTRVRSPRRALSALLFVIALAAIGARPALAHERVEIGPYVIVVGWQQEPPLVGQLNALRLEIGQGETPLEGAEGTLEVTLEYAGQTFTGNLSPAGEPGVYTVAILPTVRGQYTMRLGGTLGETAVEAAVEPEEVLPPAALAFPEVPPDSVELGATVAELGERLQAARTLAIAGAALGAAGLLAAALALARGRRSGA